MLLSACRGFCGNLLALFTLLALAACAHERTAAPTEPAALRESSRDDAWDAAFTRTDTWNNGDIAHSLPIPGGRTLWLFGDSFAGPIEEGKRLEGGTTMVRGAIAWHETAPDGEPPARIEFALAEPWRDIITADWARPAEGLWPEGTWYWLMNDGAAVAGEDGREQFVLFATAIGPAGNPEGTWNFRRIGGAVLVVENPRDPPTAWRVRQKRNPLVVETERFGEPLRESENWGLAIVPEIVVEALNEQPARYYIFGVRNDLQGHLSLLVARCEAAALDEPERWQFFDGENWSNRARNAAAVAGGLIDEFTMQWIASAEGEPMLVLIQSEPFLGRRIFARTALRPEGPWSKRKAVFDVPEPAQDKRLITYAAKGHAHLSRSGELLVSYILNSSDFWQIVSDPSLYRPRFIRVPLEMLPKPPEP